MSGSTQEGAIDWDTVEYEYRLVAGVLDDVKCTTEDDLERFRLSVATQGKFKSPLLHQIERGYVLYDEQHLSLFEEIVVEWNGLETSGESYKTIAIFETAE
jgi:hypothetical protein